MTRKQSTRTGSIVLIPHRLSKIIFHVVLDTFDNPVLIPHRLSKILLAAMQNHNIIHGFNSS